jgi:type IV secretory pathway TraG/TraD family ATPase VirD4
MITREAGATLGKVLLSMIQSFVGRVYLSGKQRVAPGLSIYIDEAQSLFYQGVEDLFAKAGSADVMVHAFAQSVNQLYAAVGEDFAKSILDNTNTKIFMRCSDPETSEYVVQHFGTRKILNSIYNPAQITTREIEEDVLKTQDILSLQPREFYMMTYSGRYRGKTATVDDPKLRIRFPDAPTAILAARHQENTHAL